MLKSFSVYAFTGIAAAAIPLVLLPVLTRYLSPFDYGVVAMFSTLTRFIVPLVSLGTPYAVSVEYFRSDPKSFAHYVPSALVPSVMSAVCLMGLALVPGLVGVPSLWGLPSSWAPMIPVVAILLVVQEIGVAMMRNVELPGVYAATRLSRVVFESTVTLLLVVALSWDWRGRAWSAVAGAAFEAMVAGFWLASRGFLGSRAKKTTALGVVRFGGPLVLEQMGSFVMNSSDRFFIETFVGLSAVGLYSVGAQFGSIVLFVHSAFETAYLPTALRALESQSVEQVRAAMRTAGRYLAALFLGWVVLALCSRLIIRLVAPATYSGAAAVVPWIGLGYVFMGVAALLRPVALFRGRTRFLGLSAVGLTALSLLFNFVLVQRLGALGSAVATALSYGCYAVAMYAVLGRELRAILLDVAAKERDREPSS